jgi:hypothetical protein
MTGDPGDVYFMHPNALHAPSPNAGEDPRLMLTQWIDGKRQTTFTMRLPMFSPGAGITICGQIYHDS